MEFDGPCCFLRDMGWDIREIGVVMKRFEIGALPSADPHAWRFDDRPTAP
jgi:hypothetical protein